MQDPLWNHYGATNQHCRCPLTYRRRPVEGQVHSRGSLPEHTCKMPQRDRYAPKRLLLLLQVVFIYKGR